MEPTSGSQCIDIRVENLTPTEVMESMRRMMRKTYLALWGIAYAIVLLVALVKQSFNLFVWFGPAIILILLALAYEYTGRKNFEPMKYGETILDYRFTPAGFRLTVGEQTVEFPWETTKVVKTRHDYLIYSDPRNSSVLPKRCLTPETEEKILCWAKGKE